MKIYLVPLIIVFSLTTNIFSQVQFTPHTITTDANSARSVFAVDVDGDGDIDVLSASEFDDKIAWYENDGNENFTPHTITTNAINALSVYAVDVDGDGDMDVLSASSLDNTITWYENDGNENFTPHNITTIVQSASSVYAVDVDGDGDIDVLSGSKSDFLHPVAWYENLSIVGIEVISNDIPSEFSLSQNYPNPFNPSTNIEYSIPEESFVELKVYDVLGNEVASLVNEQQQAGVYRADFNADNLPSGMYFARIRANEFTQVIKMTLLK